ncbi:MAG: FKBP-type peptidyl-prolyl cis-trans isomerase [Bacteroidales bacterium]|nr:FKBP-type peptidyl-prolyl cis-trans isomerase [Bacteroidales bacterium]MDD4670223.1 FKBP-type peptidyl-prolyl cis-trans isomerase [Bacteroidales bacterium]
MFKQPRYIFILLVLVLVVTSCESDKELTLVNQEESIDSYISKSLMQYEVVRSNGSNRVIIVPGEDAYTVAKGDSIKMYYEGFVFNGGPATQFVSDSIVVAVGKGDLIKGLDDGLTGAKRGEESYIIFSARYGFYDEEVGIVPAMSPLMYHTLIVDVKKNNK